MRTLIRIIAAILAPFAKTKQKKKSTEKTQADKIYPHF